jgi:hypothetical protein
MRLIPHFHHVRVHHRHHRRLQVTALEVDVLHVSPDLYVCVCGARDGVKSTTWDERHYSATSLDVGGIIL